MPDIPQPGAKEVGLELLHFAVFAVALALLPLAAAAFVRRVLGGTATFEDVAGRGELILISSGMVARGLGALLKLRTRSTAGVAFSWLAMLVLLASYLSYGMVASAVTTNHNRPIDTTFVVYSSFVFWGIGLVAGGTCIANAAMTTAGDR